MRTAVRKHVATKKMQMLLQRRGFNTGDEYFWSKPVGDVLIGVYFCIGHCHVGLYDQNEHAIAEPERFDTVEDAYVHRIQALAADPLATRSR